MNINKQFFGEEVIDCKEYGEMKDSEEIVLQYFKTIYGFLRESSTQYGVEIIKKQKSGNLINIDKTEIKNVTSNYRNIDSILMFLKQNKVTPINLIEVFEDTKGFKISYNSEN